MKGAAAGEDFALQSYRSRGPLKEVVRGKAEGYVGEAERGDGVPR